MANIGSFCSAVRNCLDNNDGHQLRGLLQLDSNISMYARQLAQTNRNAPVGEISGRLPEPWGAIVAGLVQTLIHVTKEERAAASTEFRERVAATLFGLLNQDKGEATAWLVPVMIGVSSTLKHLSDKADEESVRKGQTGTQLQNCVGVLQKAYASTATSKGSAAKRKGSIAVACLMIKVYFRLNTLTNCKQMIGQIKPELFDTYAASYRVTLRYYTGRLAAYDEDFQVADEHLTYAFENCSTAATNNQKKILRYLIPVKMLLGVLPSQHLLQKYHLAEYTDITTAMKTGDLALLTSSLEANQPRFVQSGTYLLLEKLQLAVYRRVLKRCFLVHSEVNPSKAHQVPIQLFEEALKLQGIEKDPLELQCILANLIYRKYAKGYLAYKSKVIVLAKTDPFPSLSSVQLSDPLAL